MSLIEVVVFIVVLGIAFAGVLALYNQLTRGSVDPMVRKQALAIASSLLEEIELRGFTYCDPDDSKVYSATGPSVAEGCTTVEVIGVEGAETRYGNTGPLNLRYDNVNDYNTFSMGAGTGNPMLTIDASAITGLDDYRVSVAIVNASAELPDVTVSTDALRITVTALHQPSGLSVTQQGYRLRYAPNSP
jgi:MSHA pilin protein MshD